MQLEVKKTVKEEEFVKEICEKIENEKNAALIQDILVWYLHKKQVSKLCFFIMRIINILVGASVIVMSSLSSQYDFLIVWVTIVSTANTVLLSIEALLDKKDMWRNVSKTYEAIKIETIKFVYGDTDYKPKKDQTKQDMESLFMHRVFVLCEKRLKNLEQLWKERDKKESSQG